MSTYYLMTCLAPIARPALRRIRLTRAADGNGSLPNKGRKRFKSSGTSPAALQGSAHDVSTASAQHHHERISIYWMDGTVPASPGIQVQ